MQSDMDMTDDMGMPDGMDMTDDIFSHNSGMENSISRKYGAHWQT